MPLQRTIQICAVLPCDVCDYDLRGLRSDGRCPECGTPVADTIAATEERTPEIATILERAYLQEIMEPAGCTADGALFMLAVVSFAHRRAAWHNPSPQPRHVTAAQIVAAIREYSFKYFNDMAEALDLLNEWNLRSGQDVGRVIEALITAGYLFASENDDIRQFSGLFTLDTLFDQ